MTSLSFYSFFFFNHTAPTEIYTLSLHDALPIYRAAEKMLRGEPFKREASIAKLYSSEMAMENARYATQVHGGYGFMNEFPDRKSTRLNSSHGYISYAVFCLKKKKKTTTS